jgi:iron complex outermembrane receptor protein
MKLEKFNLKRLSMCMAMAALADCAVAQTAAIEEIIVTASKTGEVAVQELSSSVVAFSAETLERMGVVEFTDFSRSVPGLDVVDLGPGQKTYIMRGVTGAGESTVGVYVDNIPMVGSGSSALLAGGNQPDMGAFDMSRVEVLRGPQGTLYGQNSMSGVVRTITNKPNSGELESKIQVDYSTVSDGSPNTSFRGMVNIPLIDDELALRLVGYNTSFGGFVDNIVLGKDASCYKTGLPNPGDPTKNLPEVSIVHGPGCLDGTVSSGQEDVNSYDLTGVRAQLGWDIDADSSLLLQYFYQDVDMDGRTATNPFESNYAIGPPFIPGGRIFYTPAAGGLNTNVRSEEPHTDETGIFAFEYERNLGEFDLVLAGSWFNRDVSDARDSSSPSRLHRRFKGASLGPWGGATVSEQDRVSSVQVLGTEQFTMEGRVSGQLNDRTSFVAGAYYQTLDTTLHSHAPQTDPRSGLPTSGAPILERTSTGEQESTAVFGEMYFDLTDRVQLIGGLRWFDMERDQVGNLKIPFVNSVPIGGVPGPQVSTPRAFDDVTMKLEGVWRFSDDAQIYYQYAEGFRPGGVNSQITPTIPLFYEPDTTESHEIGIKSAWMDDRLYANFSVYNIIWHDLQLGASFTNQFNGLVNCTERDEPAKSNGWEVEFTFQVTDAVTVGANYSDMNSRWEVDPSSCLTPELVASLSDPLGGFAGQKMTGVPDSSGSAYLNYDFNLNDISGYFRADVVYQSEVPVNQMRVDRNIKNPSYVMANARLGATRGNYDIALYVKNVTNKVANLSFFNTFQQENRVTPSQPRTIGLTLDVRF